MAIFLLNLFSVAIDIWIDALSQFITLNRSCRQHYNSKTRDATFATVHDNMRQSVHRYTDVFTLPNLVHAEHRFYVQEIWSFFMFWRKSRDIT